MGGFADRLQQRLSGGGFADRLNARMQQPQPDDGFRSITDPAAELGPEHVIPGNVAGTAQWSGGAGDTAMDALMSGAAGVYRGIGVNPADWSPEIANRLQLAEERSPYASGIGGFAGEAAIQTMAAPAALARAPVAMGAVSGALSGLGNSSGSLEDRARATAGGMAGGAVFGKAADMATGKLSSLLARKADKAETMQAIHGLMNRGATEGDLSKLGDLSDVRNFYDTANRLGIQGKPYESAVAAQNVARNAEAQRAAIEGAAPAAGVQVDPAAVAAAVRGANPYPGVPRMDRAAERAAQGVQQAGPSFAAQDLQRAYYGNSTNFASGSPNAAMGKGIHGAINNELEDALNLGNFAEPGMGTAWRQAGANENVAIEAGDMARRGLYRDAARPFDAGDFWTGGLKTLVNKNQHAIAEKAYGANGAFMRAGSDIAQASGPVAAGVFSGEHTANAPTPAAVSQGALDALYAGGSELGSYRSQFAEAAGSPNPGAITDLITRLTLSDPQFRQTLLPLLQRRAGQM